MADELHKRVIIEGDSSGARKAVDDFSKSQSKLKKETKQAAEAQKEQNEALDEASKKQSLWTRSMNLGVKATDSMLKGLKPVAAQMPILTRGINGVNAAFKLLAAHPILAILGMLAGLFDKLTQKLKGSEEMLDRVQVAMSAFEPITKVINDALAKMAEWLVAAIEKMAQFAHWVMSISPAYREAAKEAQKFAKVENDLDDKRRENRLLEAKENKEISRLRVIMADRENESLEKRTKAAKQYQKILEERMKRELAIAKQELELAKYRASLDVNSKEDNDRLVEAEAKVHDIETRINQQRRELTRQTAALTTEQRNLTKAMDEESDPTKRLQDAVDEANALNDKMSLLKQGIVIQQQYDQAVKDLAEAEKNKDREAAKAARSVITMLCQQLKGYRELAGLAEDFQFTEHNVYLEGQLILAQAKQTRDDARKARRDQEKADKEKAEKAREAAKERAKEAKELAALVADSVNRSFKSIDGLYEKALADLKALKEEQAKMDDEESSRVGDQDKYREKMYKDSLSKQGQEKYDLTKQYYQDLQLFKDNEEMKAEIKAKYEQDLADLQKKYDDEEKERQQKMLSSKLTAVGDLANAYANMFSVIGEMTDEMLANDESNAKKQFELQKALKIGAAIMSLATGSLDIAANFSTLDAKYNEVFPVAGTAMAIAETVAQATTLAATFATQIAAIKNLKFGSTNSSAGARAVSMSAPVASYQAPNSYSETQVANPQDSKVYVLESDIRQATSKVETRTTNSRY